MLVVRETIMGFKFQARLFIVKFKAPLSVLRFDAFRVPATWW